MPPTFASGPLHPVWQGTPKRQRAGPHGTALCRSPGTAPLVKPERWTRRAESSQQESSALKRCSHIGGARKPPARQHQNQKGLHCDQHEGVPKQAILACEVRVQMPQAPLRRSTGRDQAYKTLWHARTQGANVRLPACGEVQSSRRILLSVNAAKVGGHAKATSQATSAPAHETALQPACRRAPASHTSTRGCTAVQRGVRSGVGSKPLWRNFEPS